MLRAAVAQRILAVALLVAAVATQQAQGLLQRQYLGCYQDNGDHPGLTKLTQVTPWDFTIERCESLAKSLGYQYFGAQYGSECWVGNDLPLITSLGLAPIENCNMPCNGEPSEMCGAGWVNSLYGFSDAPTPLVPGASYGLGASFNTAGANIRITKVSPPDVLDNPWLDYDEAGKPLGNCYGFVRYLVTNTGDTIINTGAAGPIKVEAPAGSTATLYQPGNFSYTTDAAEGTPLSSGFVMTNIGSYMLTGTSYQFVITVKCPTYQSTLSGNGDSCSCAPGSLPNKFTPLGDISTGLNYIACPANYQLPNRKQCIKVDSPVVDTFWTNPNDGRCYGYTRWTISNGGITPVYALGYGAPMGSIPLGQMTVSMGSGTAVLFEPTPQATWGANWGFESSDIADGATQFNIQKAGHHMEPGETSEFSIAATCDGSLGCPCPGFTTTTFAFGSNYRV